jgi:hypothetical protein
MVEWSTTQNVDAVDWNKAWNRYKAFTDKLKPYQKDGIAESVMTNLLTTMVAGTRV